MLEDNPLKAKKRKQNVDLSQLSEDYRMMEQHFTNYDFLKSGRKTWFVPSSSGTSSAGSLSRATLADQRQLSGSPLSPHYQPKTSAASAIVTPTASGHALAVPTPKDNHNKLDTRRRSTYAVPIHPNAVKLEEQPMSDMMPTDANLPTPVTSFDLQQTPLASTSSPIASAETDSAIELERRHPSGQSHDRSRAPHPS